MADDDPLSDEEVRDRLTAAREAIGAMPGETTHGDTALATARRTLDMLLFAMLAKAANLRLGFGVDEDDGSMGTGPSPRG